MIDNLICEKLFSNLKFRGFYFGNFQIYKFSIYETNFKF